MSINFNRCSCHHKQLGIINVACNKRDGNDHCTNDSKHINIDVIDVIRNNAKMKYTRYL